jgi:apolipoprotein D and lipocalin family protein
MGIRSVLIMAILFVAPSALWGMGTGEPLSPLTVVPQVDLTRYMGTWYEIARFPQKFQEGCVATKATYTLRNDGKVDVLNECRLERFDGTLKRAKGTAKVADKTTMAKLKVTFFWPFYGDYWIIELGENYEYAVVGHPGRNYLWILSRRPSMDEALYDRLLKYVAAKGYDLSRLVRTSRPLPVTGG